MLPECWYQRWARDTAGTVRGPVAHLQGQLRRWVQLAEGHAQALRTKQEPSTWGEGAGEPAAQLGELGDLLSWLAHLFGGRRLAGWFACLLVFWREWWCWDVGTVNTKLVVWIEHSMNYFLIGTCLCSYTSRIFTHPRPLIWKSRDISGTPEAYRSHAWLDGIFRALGMQTECWWGGIQNSAYNGEVGGWLQLRSSPASGLLQVHQSLVGNWELLF